MPFFGGSCFAEEAVDWRRRKPDLKTGDLPTSRPAEMERSPINRAEADVATNIMKSIKKAMNLKQMVSN